uniref:DUF1618 domain-containing protein n=1 Tax=Leersia perrieri TaxID=77586 RepID=A0A0D9XZX1_9ORYZ
MAFPDWIMLDGYVFRNVAPFPDDDPTAAVGHNSRGDKVGVRFLVRAPPQPSCILLNWEEGTGDRDDFSVLAAHHDGVLFVMSYAVSLEHGNAHYMFDYLLYRAGQQPSLHLLPSLGGSVADITSMLAMDGFIRLTNQRLRRMRGLDIGVLWVTMMSLSWPSFKLPDQWEVKRPLITPVSSIAFDLESFMWYWDADTVIPFGRYLCWVDYCFGILFWDVSDENPQLHYLEFPAEGKACSYGCQTVGVTNGILKFVSLISDNDDGRDAENFSPFGSSFSIIGWTLRVIEIDMAWEKETVLKSDLLWSLDGFAQLVHHEPRVQFPLISITEPNVVYLVLRQNGKVEEAGYNYEETWLLAIDMVKKTLKMSFPYIKAEKEDISPEVVAFFEDKYWCFQPFLPAELSKYLNLRCTSLSKQDCMESAVLPQPRQFGCVEYRALDASSYARSIF